MILIAQYEVSLYHITYMKVSRADAANFMHSCAGGGPVELWHC